MRKYALMAAAAALLSGAVQAQTVIGIASGATSGTNYQMAQDVVKACSTPRMTVNNVITDGGLDNIFQVNSNKATQFGVVPEDAMFYQKAINPDMMKRLVQVFPFFTAEVHLVKKAGSPIRSLADLQGKRVVEGPKGSGTWVTVQVIKAALGLSWTALEASQTDGFNAVMAGQADAEFIVAGAPIKLLSEKSGYELVPIVDQKLIALGYYKATQLPTNTYQAVKGNVPTIYVDNLLVTFNYRNSFQEQIGSLVGCISKNLEWLQTNGHPKWKVVDPLEDMNRIKWPMHDVARAAIEKELKRTAAPAKRMK